MHGEKNDQFDPRLGIIFDPDSYELFCLGPARVNSNLNSQARSHLLPFSMHSKLNDFNGYLISGDYVSDFNDFKSFWCHRLHIVLGS